MLAVTKSLSTYKTDAVQLRDQSDPQPNSNLTTVAISSFLQFFVLGFKSFGICIQFISCLFQSCNLLLN